MHLCKNMLIHFKIPCHARDHHTTQKALPRTPCNTDETCYPLKPNEGLQNTRDFCQCLLKGSHDYHVKELIKVLLTSFSNILLEPTLPYVVFVVSCASPEALNSRTSLGPPESLFLCLSKFLPCLSFSVCNCICPLVFLYLSGESGECSVTMDWKSSFCNLTASLLLVSTCNYHYSKESVRQLFV